MTFFRAEVTPGSVTWIEASAENTIRLTSACLPTRTKKKGGRIVLQICAEREQASDDIFSVAVGVLTPPKAENVQLNILINSRMGLRLAGSDIAGAVVHVVGNHMVFAEEEDDGNPFGLPAGLVDMNRLLNGNQIVIQGSDGEESEDGDYEAEEAASDEGDSSADEGADVAAERDQIMLEAEQHRAGEVQEKALKTQKRDRTPEIAAEQEAEKKLVPKPKSGALPVMTHRSGLKFQDILIGSGRPAVKGHNVAIHYVLRLENGKVIDRADRKRPFKFRLGIGECVKGFDIGVSGMREGGERHLIVPSKLGYGSHPPPGIPKNATLYFDVGVVKAF